MSAKRQMDLAIDDFVDTALQTAEQNFGTEKCYVASEHEKHLFVLPVPPLSLQWLIESNGWPLGRVTQSGGPFGTQKSTFIFQLIRWYLEAGGFACLIDTEYKTSYSLLKSIIPPEYLDSENPKHKRLLIMNATSINEWQQMVSKQYETVTGLINKLKRTITFPIIWSVDSMMGSASAEGIEQLRTDGEAAGRGYSDAPILISNFMRTFPNTLLGLPVTFHTSHHEKPAIGHPGMNRPGGKAPDFYATLDIQFKRGGVTALGKAMEYDRAGKAFQAKNITMTIRKSSLGSDVNKEITVPFCWEFIGDTQRSWWDWDSTTAMLLADRASSLKDIMDIEHSQKQIVGEIFWSDRMGITEDNALPAAEFGRAVETDAALRAHLVAALHIQQHQVFGQTKEPPRD